MVTLFKPIDIFEVFIYVFFLIKPSETFENVKNGLKHAMGYHHRHSLTYMLNICVNCSRTGLNFVVENNNMRERLLAKLKKHPEGLTIIELSEALGITRQTAGKYVFGLISEDIVKVRKVGPAKLCFLKTRGKKSVKR